MNLRSSLFPNYSIHSLQLPLCSFAMHFLFRFLHVLISTTSASLNSCPRQRLRRRCCPFATKRAQCWWVESLRPLHGRQTHHLSVQFIACSHTATTLSVAGASTVQRTPHTLLPFPVTYLYILKILSQTSLLMLMPLRFIWPLLLPWSDPASQKVLLSPLLSCLLRWGQRWRHTEYKPWGGRTCSSS